jgi:alkanesulfonate monooxygenase SsuD/methylene tetrahydromethanopterin reductase-like flavin-dependent oxidoreductase (luciferase family)
VTALERYWKTADDLGYARITYGDGLADSTHDGWTMLGALAVLTRRARVGPAVTCAFSHPETTASPPPTASGIGVETPHQEPPRGY